MRWFVAVLIALVVAVTVWLGSAIYSVGQIANSARTGDGAAVLARTDVPALRRSLTEQIVRAYLERLGETRKVSQFERLVSNTYGATLADAMVAKLMTAETLTNLLKSGRFDGADKAPAFDGLPSLGDVNTDDMLDVLGRVHFIQPVLLAIRVSTRQEADQFAAIQMHLDGSGWRLAGIEIPKAIIGKLAASLPAK